MAIENYIRGSVARRRVARRRARAAEEEMTRRVNATIARIARTPPATLHQENRGPVKLLDNHEAIVANLQKQNNNQKKQINNQKKQIKDLLQQVEDQRATITALKDFIKLIDENESLFSLQKIKDILTGKTPSIEDFEVVCDTKVNESPLDQSAMNVAFEGPYSEEEAKKIITGDTTDVDSQEN